MSELFDILPLCVELDPQMTLLETSRKTIRMDITHSRPIVYVSFPGAGGELYRVQNLSEQGAGILAKNLSIIPERLLLRDTHLFVGKSKLEIKTNLLYFSGGVGGISFVDPLQPIKPVLARNFGIEMIGASLEPKHYYSRIPGHPYRKLCYTDGLNTLAEFVFNGNGLHAFGFDLEPLGIKVRWTVATSLEILGGPSTQILGFLQNLRGLGAAARQSVQETLQSASTHAA